MWSIDVQNCLLLCEIRHWKIAHWQGLSAPLNGGFDNLVLLNGSCGYNEHRHADRWTVCKWCGVDNDTVFNWLGSKGLRGTADRYDGLVAATSWVSASNLKVGVSHKGAVSGI